MPMAGAWASGLAAMPKDALEPGGGIVDDSERAGSKSPRCGKEPQEALGEAWPGIPGGLRESREMPQKPPGPWSAYSRRLGPKSPPGHLLG